MSVEWPQGFERTPADDRRDYPHGFKTERIDAFHNIATELDRMDVDDWRVESGTDHRQDEPHIPYKNAPNYPDDPGVVARWSKHGEQYAAACDRWSNVRDNAQAIARYLDAKRAIQRYGVATVGDEFATQALPSGEDAEGIVVMGDGSSEAAHEVLGVAPDASADVVKAVARRLMANEHPDAGGDEARYKDIQRAKKEMLA